MRPPVQRGLGDAARHRGRHAARPHRHPRRGAADHPDLQARRRRRRPDPDLHVRGRHLRRQPQRDPAQHPGHARQRRHLARRLPAGPPGRPARRWASPPPARSRQPSSACCSARSRRCWPRPPWVPVLRVLLAGRLRRRHLGPLTAPDDPIKGWIAGFLGLLAAMVGQEGIYAYARFAYGSTDLAGGFGLLPAGGRLRLRRGPVGDANPAYQAVKDAAGSVIPRIASRLRHWGRSSAPASSAPSWASSPASARTWAPGSPTPRPRASKTPRSSARARSRASWRRDRQQRRRPGRHHPGPHAGDPRLGAGGGAAGRDVHPRRPAGPADHDREPAVRLRGHRDDLLRQRGDPGLRPAADEADAAGAARAARG
jgi:hypothetical protein